VLTPEEQSARLDELSRAYHMMRADPGDDMTTQRVRDMPMSEFAKLRASVLGDEADPTPTTPTVAPVPDDTTPHGARSDDMPPDFRNMGMTEYSAVRSRFIRPVPDAASSTSRDTTMQQAKGARSDPTPATQPA
jgi:hypothetical protein